MKKLALGWLILIAFQGLKSQGTCNYKIGGRLLNASDSSPIAYAELFIEKGHNHTNSSTSGRFLLSGICAGPTIIEVDKYGFKHLHIDLRTSCDTDIVIFLQPITQQADTIIIHGGKEKSAAMLLKGNAIRTSTGLDFSNIASQIPGIQLLQGGKTQNKPMARGMYGLRLPIINNQFKIEGQGWGNDHNPEADAQSFDELEFIKDAGLLRYAHDAIGGALRLKRQAQAHEGEQTLNQSISYHSNGHQAAYGAKYVHRTDSNAPVYFINTGLRRSGNYRTSRQWLDNTGLGEISLAAGATTHKGNHSRHIEIDGYRFEGGIFSGTRTGSVQDLLNAIQREKPLTADVFGYATGQPKQVVGHISLQAGNSLHKGNNQHEWAIGMQYDQRREFDFHRNSGNQFPQLDLVLLSPSLIYRYHRHINNNLQLELGNQATGYMHRYGGYYFLPDFQGWQNGTYAWLHHHGAAITQTWALRVDEKIIQAKERIAGQWHQQSRFFNDFSFAYTGLFQTNKQQLQWHFSRQWRAPWINELYAAGVHHGSAAYEQGNRLLKKEHSYRLEAEWQCSQKQLFCYVSPYINWLPGFINLTPMNAPVQSVRGAFPGYYYLQSDALFTGIDATLEIRPNQQLSVKTTVGYVQGKYTSENRYPSFVPPFRLTGEITYHTSILNIQVLGERIAQQRQYNTGSDLLAPPPAYTLWHLNMALPESRKNKNWDFKLRISNVFNLSYRSYMDRFRYFMDMPGRNIALTFMHQIHHHNKKHLHP
jgi:iron complex outermembrane receptor protein